MEKTYCTKSVAEFYQKYKSDTGQYKSTLIEGTTIFEIDQRYQILDKIGHGAFGVVIAAKDQSVDGKLVTIQQVENPFRSKIESLRLLKEIKLLRLLKHENIINMETVLLPQSREQFQSIYIVFEYMESDLGAVLSQKQKELTLLQKKFIVYQICRALQFLKGTRVLHGDLIPRNILLTSNYDLQLCHFGVSRYLDNQFEIELISDQALNRTYRSPQIQLNCAIQDVKPDIWSTGVILGELIQNKPFLPGGDTKDQISLIFNALGSPESIDIFPGLNQKFLECLKNLPVYQGVGIQHIYEGEDPEAIDLLQKMLEIDPSQRISIQDAIKHPFLREYFDPTDEPVGEEINPLEFQYQGLNLTCSQIADLIYEEILLLHFPQFKKEYQEKLNRQQSVQKHIFENDNQNLIDSK